MSDLPRWYALEAERLQAENERLRAGLQLIAGDKNRLMNEVARQTAASILGGKPIGEVAEWPKRDATSAQLAEEQRFLHSAPAVTGLTQQDYDALVRDAMLWRTRSPTGAGGNARAFMCCEGVGQHAPGCIAQEAARCNCDLPMPVNSVDGDGLAWCITCGFNIGTTP